MTQEQATTTEMSTIRGRGSVEAGGLVAAQPGADQKVRKVIVAVHGVGDQYNFATIQAVVNQFCRFHGEPAAVPLGRFHGEPRFSISPPFPQGTFDHLAFAEVYWAKVPREVVGDQHTIEESKKWAGTLVERLRLGWHLSGRKKECMEADYDRIRLVVEEMIQTLAVLERLSFLASQAGLFTFNLKKLLENYLGDVQIVTEFDSSRRTILDAFKKTMDDVSTQYPNADVYLIAHSEGTVISFLGLLEAGRQQPPPNWIGQVRGFMTLGSPLDKHLILWPGLFGDAPPSHDFTPTAGIEWRNYYDRGDPIGFDLDRIRKWIDVHGWRKVFSFSAMDDYGFVRYPFPGKAHVDYWNDPEVFGHFIETVVKEPQPDTPVRPAAAPAPARKPPSTLRLKKVLSYVVPYILVSTLVLIGVYFLFRAVDGALKPDEPMGLRTAIHLVAATVLLVLGVTVAVRVPRLTRDVKSRIAGVVIASIIVIAGLKIGEGMGAGPDFITRFSNTQYMIAAILLVVVALLFSGRWPSYGPKVVAWLGTAAIATFLIWGMRTTPANELGSVWPVILALAVFLYLWWLAALLLDLVLVWHFLVHSPSRVRKSLATMAGEPLEPA